MNNNTLGAYVTDNAIAKAEELGYNKTLLDFCKETKNSLEFPDVVYHRNLYEFLEENDSQMDNNAYNANSDIIHRMGKKDGKGLIGFENFQRYTWNKGHLVNNPNSKPFEEYIGRTRNDIMKKINKNENNKNMSRQSSSYFNGNQKSYSYTPSEKYYPNSNNPYKSSYPQPTYQSSSYNSYSSSKNSGSYSSRGRNDFNIRAPIDYSVFN